MIEAAPFRQAFGAAREEREAQGQTVERYLVTSVPTATRDARAAAVREGMANRRYDAAAHVFVLGDNGQLVGVVDIVDLFAAEPATPLAGLMREASRHVVTPEMDREEAATIAIRSGVSTLAVCDATGRFIGAMPASALISVLREEHLEDLHHMAGILGKSEEARASLSASPLRRALYRLPWVAVGLAGSFLITAIMARFEASLSANIALAFFIPAIVYLADAIGTQTEVVAVRTFSLAETSFVSFFAAEVGTGAIVGLTLSVLALPAIWIVFGNFMLGLTVAIALFAATTVATAVGFLLPWIFDRLGLDPALGSGPIATVFQDTLTLLIYFVVAAVLLF